MSTSESPPGSTLNWPSIARRVVQAAGVRAGEVVLIRGAGAVLEEVSLAVEAVGATPLPEIAHALYLRDRLMRVDPAHLATWDQHRAIWMRRVDRRISLTGGPADLTGVPAPALQAWEDAVARLVSLEEERAVPVLMVAVPDPAQAEILGMTAADLEAVILPALAVPSRKLRSEIERALAVVQGASTLTVRTGESGELLLSLGDRRWLSDDGLITETDVAAGAGVSNLPAGSIYTTVVEEATEGVLWLPQAGPAADATLRFEAGRVVEIQAREGAAALDALLDRHGGESRRVSHVGIGLNPALRRPVGWTLVDENAHGAVFIALGENRYMGGQNASSLNIDFCISGATVMADDRVVVKGGVLIAPQ